MKHSAVRRNWYPVLPFHKHFPNDIYLVTMFCPFSLASQNNYRINSNQELLAIGKTPAAGRSRGVGGGGVDAQGAQLALVGPLHPSQVVQFNR